MPNNDAKNSGLAVSIGQNVSFSLCVTIVEWANQNGSYVLHINLALLSIVI